MNRNRKAAKFSFMYLVSSKKDFCLYFDKEFFGKNSGFWPERNQTYFLEVLQPRSKNEKKNSVSELKYIVGTDISRLETKSKEREKQNTN